MYVHCISGKRCARPYVSVGGSIAEAEEAAISAAAAASGRNPAAMRSALLGATASTSLREPLFGAAGTSARAVPVSKAARVAELLMVSLRWALSQSQHALQWFVILVIVLIYLAVQTFLPVPGCPTGYIGPGGRGDEGAYANCVGGAHGYVDRLLWGDDHIYHHPTCSHPDSYRCTDAYNGEGTHGYDPEGSLGSLMAVFECWLGLQAGRILVAWTHRRNSTSFAKRRARGESTQLVRDLTSTTPGGAPRGAEKPTCVAVQGLYARWLFWGVILSLLATLLCFGRQNGGPIPLNKNLWSPSFVLLLAGLAFLILAVLHAIVDWKEIGSQGELTIGVFAFSHRFVSSFFSFLSLAHPLSLSRALEKR